MKKKLALLLCLVLLVTALALPVSADNSAAWDGSVDTSWYSAEAKTFEISTPAQLAGLAAIVSGEATGIKADNFNGKTIKLTADLDLGGVKAAHGTWSGPCWKPIGNGSAKPFAGKLLGGGQYFLIGNMIENQLITVGEWNFGSAISMIMAVIMMVLMMVVRKIEIRNQGGKGV